MNTFTQEAPQSNDCFRSKAWKLTDQQIADVTSYIRNSWGNQAQPVSEFDVRELRTAIGARLRSDTVTELSFTMRGHDCPKETLIALL
jgi:hypothetical protein